MRSSIIALLVAIGIGAGCASAPDEAPSAPAPMPPSAEPVVAPDPDAEATAPSAPVQETPAEPPPAPETTAQEPVLPPPRPESVRPPPAPARAVDAPDREPRVELVQFTTSVENREPVDAVTFLRNDVREILFYTDLRDLSGATVIHRWEYEGEVVAEVPFAVGGNRWRVWSSKSLDPDSIGDWTVSVVAPDGEVLAVETLSYQSVR